MKNEDVPKKKWVWSPLWFFRCLTQVVEEDVTLKKCIPCWEFTHAERTKKTWPRKNRERKNVTNFFQMSGLSSYPLRHFDSFLRIMSIIIRSYTPSFLGMIPQKLLTNLEESPWNLSENLRKVLVLLPVFVQSSCGHANIVISWIFQPNARQLQQLGRFWMQNHEFKKMIMLRPFLIGLTLEWLKQLQDWHFNSPRVRTKHGKTRCEPCWRNNIKKTEIPWFIDEEGVSSKMLLHEDV